MALPRFRQAKSADEEAELVESTCRAQVNSLQK